MVLSCDKPGWRKEPIMATKVYRAILYERAGFVARIDRALTFLDSADESTTEIEPEMFAFCGDIRRVPADEALAIVARMRGCHEYLNCAMGS